MTREVWKQREEQINRCVPEIWDCKSALIIGVRVDYFPFKHRFEQFKVVDAIEIDRDACVGLESVPWLTEIYCQDICSFFIYNNAYDLIFWSHGPSVLTDRECAERVLVDIRRKARMAVALMPWGKYKNSLPETHPCANKLAFYPEELENLGYKTNTIGEKDVVGSNLLAWSVK